MDTPPDIQLPVSSIGVVIPFVLTDGGVLLSNAASAAVTWLSTDGTKRVLTLASAASAEFTWTTSANEFRSARHELGYLVVSFYTNTFFSSSFSVNIAPHF
jgi:hypothetical protein